MATDTENGGGDDDEKCDYNKTKIKETEKKTKTIVLINPDGWLPGISTRALLSCPGDGRKASNVPETRCYSTPLTWRAVVRIHLTCEFQAQECTASQITITTI